MLDLFNVAVILFYALLHYSERKRKSPITLLLLSMNIVSFIIGLIFGQSWLFIVINSITAIAVTSALTTLQFFVAVLEKKRMERTNDY